MGGRPPSPAAQPGGGGAWDRDLGFLGALEGLIYPLRVFIPFNYIPFKGLKSLGFGFLRFRVQKIIGSGLRVGGLRKNRFWCGMQDRASFGLYMERRVSWG